MPTEQPYLRPAQGQVSETVEIKRSQFIAVAQRTDSEAAARAFIDDVRSTYPDARHHCTAYIIHQDGAQPIERSSDDGEPAGTAGQPMLEVLRGREILDITVVVVRYFGGVLLGTGGLVRAYQQATRAAVDSLSLVRRHHVALHQFTVGHDQAGRVEAELRAAGYTIADVEYAAEVTMTIAAEPGTDVAGAVASLTGGDVEVTSAGEQWVDSPVA